MAKSRHDRERERLLLEETFPDGPIESMPTMVRLLIVSDPVERILIQFEDSLGIVRFRQFMEKADFREFSELVGQVARDAGCYLPEAFFRPADEKTTE